MADDSGRLWLALLFTKAIADNPGVSGWRFEEFMAGGV